MITKIGARVRQVPPWMWAFALLAVAVAFLAWDRFNRDEGDPDWTTPKETQPPTVLKSVPAHGTGRPMACGPAFRGRQPYAGSLVEADFSLVKDC